ncbi:hypothetical protein AgCh_001641 [Apium graveolens]
MTSPVAYKPFDNDGAKFVTNNYSAILNNNSVNVDFRIFQDFLRSSEIGFALTAPPTISGDQVLAIWRTEVYDDEGANGSPNLVFEFDNKTRIVTPQSVRDALQFPTHTSYTRFMEDTEMRRFFTEIGYDKDLKNLEFVKRKLVLAGLESDSDEDNVTLSSRFPNLSSGSSPKPVEIVEETKSSYTPNPEFQTTAEAPVELCDSPIKQYNKRSREISHEQVEASVKRLQGKGLFPGSSTQEPVSQRGVYYCNYGEESQEPGCQSYSATPDSPTTHEPLHQSFNEVPPLNVCKEAESLDSQGINSDFALSAFTSNTDLVFSAFIMHVINPVGMIISRPEILPVVAEDEVAQQSIHRVLSIIGSPQHSTRIEVLEVNFKALVHLSTILEDVEFNDDCMEASEAVGSHTTPISDSILHAEAGDEVQQIVQDPVANEESNNGKEADISNVLIDPEDDLFFPEDMPNHVRSLYTAQEATTSQINQIKESLLASRACPVRAYPLGVVSSVATWLVCVVYLLDSQFMTYVAKFISGCMASLSVMVQLEPPHVNILSKMDLVRNKKDIEDYLNPEPQILLAELNQRMAPQFRKLF